MNAWLIALLVGLVQGLLEWLPVSSEGSVAVVLGVVAGADPGGAVRYALFLHAGTALAAASYYRRELCALAAAVPGWRPGSAFHGGSADLTFLGVATATSAAVGGGAYLALSDLADVLSGGVFVAVVGALLAGTGLLQRTAAVRGAPGRDRPDASDAVVVGALQGLAVLPGVSRSGTTVSALLLRGHDGPASFRLSFLLSIPAAAGAGLLVAAESGLPTAGGVGALALGVSAGVGYLAVGALVELAERVPFWGLCVGFGLLAVAGGLAATV